MWTSAKVSQNLHRVEKIKVTLIKLMDENPLIQLKITKLSVLKIV